MVFSLLLSFFFQDSKESDNSKKQPKIRQRKNKKPVIQFKLAGRDPHDPAYTDPNATPNIFVPVEGPADTVLKIQYYWKQEYEKRKKEIIAQLGAEGVGAFKQSEATDSIEAAFKVFLNISKNMKREEKL